MLKDWCYKGANLQPTVCLCLRLAAQGYIGLLFSCIVGFFMCQVLMRKNRVT